MKGFEACLKQWHSKNPKALPCLDCVAGDNELIQIHMEMIGRIPGGCHTVCEAGFNRGDESLILSTACGQTARVLSFAHDKRLYTKAGLQCAGAALNGTNSTVTLVEGNSTHTIEKFLEQNAEAGNPILCDVVHINGCEDAWCRHEDLRLLAIASHEGTLWISSNGAETTCEPDVRGKKVSTCAPTWEPNSNHHPHCHYETFISFTRAFGIETRCINHKPGDRLRAVCYGYKPHGWKKLLQMSSADKLLAKHLQEH